MRVLCAVLRDDTVSQSVLFSSTLKRGTVEAASAAARKSDQTFKFVIPVIAPTGDTQTEIDLRRRRYHQLFWHSDFRAAY